MISEGSAPTSEAHGSSQNGDGCSAVEHLPRSAISDGTLVRLARSGDPVASDELVRRHEGLARSLARRFVGGREAQEDLEQVALVGLVKAVGRFDETRGTPFAGFAVPTMLGELRRHLRDHARVIHLPRRLHEHVVSVNAAVNRLSAQGQRPTPAEIADEVAISLDEVIEALDALTVDRPLSTDAPRDGEDGMMSSLSEAIGGHDPGYDLADHRSLIDSLAERDRLIVHLRFVEDLTQAEIGDRIGVSQMQVSRLLRRILEDLRATDAALGATG